MAEDKNFEGGIPIGSGFYPRGKGYFLMRADDIQASEGKSLADYIDSTVGTITELQSDLNEDNTIKDLYFFLRNSGIAENDIALVAIKEKHVYLGTFKVYCKVVARTGAMMGADNYDVFWKEMDCPYYVSGVFGLAPDIILGTLREDARNQLKTEQWSFTGAINELNNKISDLKDDTTRAVGTWLLNEELDGTGLPNFSDHIKFDCEGIFYLRDKPEFRFTQVYFYTTEVGPYEFGVLNDEATQPLYYGSGWDEVAGERKMKILTEPIMVGEYNLALWINANGKRISSSGDESSTRMPTIRYTGLRGNNILSNLDGEESTVDFTVEIADGSVQVGDTLQICAMRTFSESPMNPKTKKKLRRFAEYVITEDDLDKRFLTLTVPPTKKVFAYIKHNNMGLGGPGIFYFRIRRPKGEIQGNASGMTVDAEFSNVVPVSMLNIQSDYQEDDEGNQFIAVKINVI